MKSYEFVRKFNSIGYLAITDLSPLSIGSIELAITELHCSCLKSGTPIEEHQHPDYELSFHLSGNNVTYCEGEQIFISHDNRNCLFLPPGYLHHRVFGNEPGPHVTFSMCFSMYGKNVQGEELCLKLPDVLKENHFTIGALQSQIEFFQNEFNRLVALPEPAQAEVAASLVELLLKLIFQKVAPGVFGEGRGFPRCANRPEEIAREIRSLLVNFLNRKLLKFKELEKSFHLSTRQLNRIFRKQYGVSMKAYHMQLRKKLAENLLGTSAIPVTEIAHTLGFSEVRQFSSFFKKYHQGLSPRAYRDSKNSMSETVN